MQQKLLNTLLFLAALFIMYKAFQLFNNKWDQQITDKDTTEQQHELPDDFIDFYKSFHSDSIYQLQHISFPLEGIKKDSIGNIPHQWTPDEWIIHKSLHGYDDYRIFYSIDDDLVHEYVEDNSGTFRMKRTFHEYNNIWNLIFYEEMGYAD